MIASLPQWSLALAGGLLIGTAAAGYLLFNGRIAGISGMAAGALGLSRHGGRAQSALFLVGLVAGTLAASAWLRAPQLVITGNVALLVAGGLLVGYGTRLGSGCTSGHGVCGLARLSPRSIAATAVFMATAAATVFVARHVLGAAP